MGVFDISLVKNIKTNKNKMTIKENLCEELKIFSNNDIENTNDSFEIKGFKSSIFKFDLNVDIDKNSKNEYDIIINGELQQSIVLALVILIVLAIVFTYGLAIIVIAIFTLWQKSITSKKLEEILSNTKAKLKE